MDFFEVIEKRRSIRHFTNEPVPDAVVEKALRAAVLAPNSSNTQTWNFFWVVDADKKEALVKACLGQSAARKAQQIIVVTADPQLWKRSQKGLIQWVLESKAPPAVLMYYEKLIPITYRWGLLNCLAPLKWIVATAIGLFRPITRRPFTRRDMQEVAIKSAALAAENLVLAVTAQGYSSCMMEGFDECRVRRLLKLKRSERVVMVIGIGQEGPRGTWGARYRLDFDEVVKKV
jgi:nitroreductase